MNILIDNQSDMVYDDTAKRKYSFLFIKHIIHHSKAGRCTWNLLVLFFAGCRSDTHCGRQRILSEEKQISALF